MGKISRRIVSILSALLLIVMFASCKKESGSENCVVQLDLNPSIEFCVDDEGKVISVTCLNDDGAELISGQVFIGEEIKDAAKKYIELAKEHGYIIKERAGQAKDQIDVAISGAKSSADEIYSQIESSVKDVINQAKLNVELHKEYLSKETLKEKLNNCLVTVDTSSLSEEELAQLLADYRKQVENITSPIMQDMYYLLQSYEEVLAEAKGLLDVINENVTGLQKTIVAATTAPLSVAVSTLETAVNGIKSAYETNFLGNASSFKVCLDNYFEAKQAYLQARLDLSNEENEQLRVTLASTLATVQATLATVQSLLNVAKQTAQTVIDGLKTTSLTIISNVKTAVETVKAGCKTYFTEEAVKAEVEKAMNEFATTFKTTYKQAMDSYLQEFENNK